MFTWSKRNGWKIGMWLVSEMDTNTFAEFADDYPQIRLLSQYDSTIEELINAMALINAEVVFTVNNDGSILVFPDADSATIQAWREITEREYANVFAAADYWANQAQISASVTDADFFRKHAEEIKKIAQIKRNIENSRDRADQISEYGFGPRGNRMLR